MRNFCLLLIRFVPFALAAACSSSDSSPASPAGGGGTAGDAGDEAQAGQGGSGGVAGDSGTEAETTPGSDGNDDCAHALALTFGGHKIAAIQAPGDVDYFEVDAPADAFVKLRTVANANAVPEQINTVLTVLDSNGQAVGYNDDYNGSDSQLIYRTPASGKLCVQVQDYSSWKSLTPLRGDASFSYSIYAEQLTESSTKVHDTEPNDDAAGAQSAGTSIASLNYLWGTLSKDSDVDVYRLGISAKAQFHCEGSTSREFDGSTMAAPRITLLDQTGATILARLDPFKPQTYLCAWFEPGATSLLMMIEKPAGADLGSNPYYVREWNAGELSNYGNHYELETTPGANDTAAGAEEPPYVTITAGQIDYPVFGRIQQAGDVDYYAVTAAAGQVLEFDGRAATIGSGLTGVQFSLRDAADQEVRSEVENGAVVVWSDARSDATNGAIPITVAGTYYVRVSAAGQSAEVTGQLYALDVVLKTP